MTQDDDEKPIRKTVSLPARLWRVIEDFQFKYRIKRDAAKVRQLIEMGLQAEVQKNATAKAE